MWTKLQFHMLSSGRCWQLRCYPAPWLHQTFTRKCKSQRKVRKRLAEVKGSHASCWLLTAGLDSRRPGRWQRKHTSTLSNSETICWIALKANVAASPAKSRSSHCLLQWPPGAVLHPFRSPCCCALVCLSTSSYPHHTAQINHCLALRSGTFLFLFPSQLTLVWMLSEWKT